LLHTFSVPKWPTIVEDMECDIALNIRSILVKQRQRMDEHSPESVYAPLLVMAVALNRNGRARRDAR
jgi:hypothetical protein